MGKLTLIAALCCALLACSARESSAELETADAQAEADEATAVDFSGAALSACALLSKADVASAIGPLVGEPVSPPEEAADTAESRCVWHAAEDRALALSASKEGGAERLGAIAPVSEPGVTGTWDQARLQGCCLLHAVRDEAMLSLDFSSARIDVAQAAKLMDAALARIGEPLDTP